MPTIDLKIPSNSRFHSSLNEIDIALKSILINQMRIADPRNKSGIQGNWADKEEDYLWNEARVFQVDELTTEEIFDTYLLRKNINKEKGTDISYPLLAYMENDIETVFWGTGNRYRQWYLDLPIENSEWEVGDEVVITDMSKYRGLKGKIADLHTHDNQLYCYIDINGEVIKERSENLKYYNVEFNINDIKQLTPDKIANKYKAKSITGTYTATILCDNRDEIQYLRDKFMLRCADGQIWHKFSSPTIKGAENQIFTVFGIPNISKYPLSKDKLKGEGYIYGTAFNINIWSCITDEPLPQSYIEMIRMNLTVEGDGRTNRIIIN